MKHLYIFTVILFATSCNSSVKSVADSTPKMSYLADCSGETGEVDSAWGKSIRPMEIYLNALSPCMNNGVGDKIEVTSWSTWSSDVATGIGRFGVNTYDPNGAAEYFDFYEVTITLDAPINGFFSKMHLTWSIRPPTALETYDIAPMSFKEGLLLNGPENDCSLGWIYNDTLPLKLCDRGRGVEIIQSQFGLDMDGEFGVETWKSIGRFQLDNDLDEFGEVGPETWAKLFPNQAGLPGRDYNGDSLVTPNEFGE